MLPLDPQRILCGVSAHYIYSASLPYPGFRRTSSLFFRNPLTFPPFPALNRACDLLDVMAQMCQMRPRGNKRPYRVR